MSLEIHLYLSLQPFEHVETVVHVLPSSNYLFDMLFEWIFVDCTLAEQLVK
jgi:hypothetical protein